MGRIPRPLLIGSTATNYWYPEFRKKDVDCYVSIVMKLALHNSKVDTQLATKTNGLIQICKFPYERETEIDEIRMNIADPEVLLMIKRVHLEFTDRWLKNVKDYIFLRNKGIKPNQHIIELFRTRLAYLRKYRTKPNKNMKIPEDEQELSDAVENRNICPIEAAKFLIKKAGIDLLPMT